MSLVKLCGLCLLLAVLALTARESGGRFVPLVGLAGGILLVGAALNRYGEVIGVLSGLSENALFSSLFSLALRIIALCILTEVSAGICRDMGEATLAARLELCGRAEILVVCLPTLARLLSLATEQLAL